MGLIRAGAGAVGSVFGDQWKEYFYCDALEQDVLVRKGSKRTGKKSSNKGSDNIISNGSVIAVADGQCMLMYWFVRALKGRVKSRVIKEVTISFQMVV